MQRSYLHTSATVDARPRSAAEQRRPQIAPRPAVESAVGIGTIYVQCTKNNTICTLVDMKGMPLAWTSAGSCGFKNSRKKSTQVSQQVAETLIEKVLEKGFKDVRSVVLSIWLQEAGLFLNILLNWHSISKQDLPRDLHHGREQQICVDALVRILTCTSLYQAALRLEACIAGDSFSLAYFCRVVMKGLGYGKQSAVRAITKSRLRVLEIHEQTAIPHNGCRAPKRRRI